MRLPLLTAAVAAGMIATLALAGCGSDEPSAAAPSAEPTLDLLPGSKVGALAEKQLETEHQEMAVGSVTCPDLPWKVQASVRCMKVSELSDGRRVRIPGTVTVTSTEGYGSLHVVLDDEAEEFGVAAATVAADVTAWVASHGRTPADVRCPYLRGAVDEVVRCRLTIGGKAAAVAVTVTDVEPETYATTYAINWVERPHQG